MKIYKRRSTFKKRLMGWDVYFSNKSIYIPIIGWDVYFNNKSIYIPIPLRQNCNIQETIEYLLKLLSEERRKELRKIYSWVETERDVNNFRKIYSVVDPIFVEFLINSNKNE